MTRKLRNSLTHYFDHIEDAPWIESLIKKHSLKTVLQTCVDVLADQDPTEVHPVTTFLRDIGVRGHVNNKLVARVRRLMPTSVLPALRPLLRAPALLLRQEAIYTIGKLSFPSEAKALREVFPEYLDRDPLCLLRLLLELEWLGDRRFVRTRLNRIVTHESFLIRWSLLEYLCCGSVPDTGSGLRLKRRLFHALAADPVQFIAREARHWMAVLELRVAELKAKSKPEATWQKKRSDLDKKEPVIAFESLEIQFQNEMHRNMQVDYSLKQLAKFTRTLRKSAKK